eukprot:GHRQ01024934.1.p1 GENE.GHRQ01024934.1~~GHRQ01024934.1.p1  ORF type:complete len:160 (-),score=43.06 GHRQ01024934.1:567-1046(-)
MHATPGRTALQDNSWLLCILQAATCRSTHLLSPACRTAPKRLSLHAHTSCLSNAFVVTHSAPQSLDEFLLLIIISRRLDNAASGGFSGFTFPHAPRAIKDHRNIKQPNGYPFDPSTRPFLLFKGNSAHSTGYFWEHNAAVYMGGMLFYKTDPADGQVRL